MLAAPPTLGPGRLVCVDGPAGSGKTTLAGALVRAVPGSQLVQCDDLLHGWQGLPGLADSVAALLEPLARGEVGAWRRWDWHADDWAETHQVSPGGLLVLEGVGSLVAGDRRPRRRAGVGRGRPRPPAEARASRATARRCARTGCSGGSTRTPSSPRTAPATTPTWSCRPTDAGRPRRAYASRPGGGTPHPITAERCRAPPPSDWASRRWRHTAPDHRRTMSCAATLGPGSRRWRHTAPDHRRTMSCAATLGPASRRWRHTAPDTAERCRAPPPSDRASRGGGTPHPTPRPTSCAATLGGAPAIRRLTAYASRW